jgi:hypothetical protein
VEAHMLSCSWWRVLTAIAKVRLGRESKVDVGIMVVFLKWVQVRVAIAMLDRSLEYRTPAMIGKNGKKTKLNQLC